MGSCQTGTCGSESGKPDEDAGVRESLGKIGRKLLVMSGKGGVGKTSVSVNLAISLAQMGFSVGLMDVDIHGPDVPRMLGLSRMLELNEKGKLSPLDYSDYLKVVSVESLIPDKDKAIIWRGPMKFSAIKQFIGDVDWGDLDFLIIDSPPGTGDEPLTIAQTIKDAKAVVVTTPQEVSLADVRKSISFCETVNMEIAGVVENMSGFVCPRCGESVPLFGTGGGERMAKSAGIPFLGRIPFDPGMVQCSDAGISYLATNKESEATKSFKKISETIADSENGDANKTEKGRNNHMKFAIPLADGKLTAHFGHCKEFALIDTDAGKIGNKEILTPPPHEPGTLPKWLAELGTDVVIAGGMGARAVELLSQSGIQVLMGAPLDAPETLVMSYLNKTLVGGQNLCDGDHHECGGHA